MTGIHTSSINHDYYADKLLNSHWNGPKENQLTILIRHWHAFERIVVSQPMKIMKCDIQQRVIFNKAHPAERPERIHQAIT